MRYESIRTEKDNIGVSYSSQAEADLQAGAMDAANCTYCTDCRNCTDCTTSPLQITSLTWLVTIKAESEEMIIGCQQHKIDRWKEFSDKQVAAMADEATEFWNTWKDVLLAMCDKQLRQLKK